MLKVYTGDCKDSFKDIEATYDFPENGLSPWEQLDWMDDHLDEFREKDVVITTFSPYIMNYLNLLLIRDKIEIKAFELNYFSFESEVQEYELNIKTDEDHEVIDTRGLSDPISQIYKEYNKIKFSNENNR